MMTILKASTVKKLHKKTVWQHCTVWVASLMINGYRSRIQQIDEAMVWEIKQGMSKARFLQANKQVATIKARINKKIRVWESRRGL